MATQENRQLLDSIFQSLAAGDSRPLVAAMADDFRWRFAGEWSWARDWGARSRRSLLACWDP